MYIFKKKNTSIFKMRISAWKAEHGSRAAVAMSDTAGTQDTHWTWLHAWPSPFFFLFFLFLNSEGHGHVRGGKKGRRRVSTKIGYR